MPTVALSRRRQDELRGELARMAAQVAYLESSLASARALRDRTVRQAYGELPTGELARLAGIARQRVHQIMTGEG